MTKTRITILLSAAMFAATISLPAFAQSVCGATRAATADDLQVLQRWGCAQESISRWWDVYDYDKGNWDDDNWGYYAPCDARFPLAGAFNANFVLDSTNAFKDYASSRLDELDGESCGDGTAYATTVVTPWDVYTDLHLLFFYDYSPMARAGTLVHEARHSEGKGHTEPNYTCTRQGSCDTYYGDGGANSYQIDFLWAFSKEEWQPLAMRQQAAERANLIGSIAFRYTLFSPDIPVPTF